MTDEHLATLTHVRLRAAQGDVSAARRMLRAILDEHPDYLPALTLLERLTGRPSADSVSATRAAAADVDETLPPPEPGNATRLAGRFRRELVGPGGRRAARIRRLENWLDRIVRRAGDRA